MRPSLNTPDGGGTTAIAVFLCLILLFGMGGCARQPWTEPVDDNQAKAIRSMIQDKVKAEASCSSTLDADITVTWKTAVETKSFSGYLQLKLPSFVKFVATNPLGQTLVALVSDGESFRSVNTLEHQFISGGLASLALRNDIPPELLTGSWGTWLNNRIEIPNRAEITEVRQDVSGRGVWITIARPKSKTEGKEYILIDPATTRPLQRVLADAQENAIARITYSDWQPGSPCAQPATFQITGLAMGTEITIHLADIVTTKVLTERDFSLRPPPNYFIQLLP